MALTCRYDLLRNSYSTLTIDKMDILTDFFTHLHFNLSCGEGYTIYFKSISVACAEVIMSYTHKFFFKTSHDIPLPAVTYTITLFCAGNCDFGVPPSPGQQILPVKTKNFINIHRFSRTWSQARVVSCQALTHWLERLLLRVGIQSSLNERKIIKYL